MSGLVVRQTAGVMVEFSCKTPHSQYIRINVWTTSMTSFECQNILTLNFKVS